MMLAGPTEQGQGTNHVPLLEPIVDVCTVWQVAARRRCRSSGWCMCSGSAGVGPAGACSWPPWAPPLFHTPAVPGLPALPACPSPVSPYYVAHHRTTSPSPVPGAIPPLGPWLFFSGLPPPFSLPPDYLFFLASVPLTVRHPQPSRRCTDSRLLRPVSASLPFPLLCSNHSRSLQRPSFLFCAVLSVISWTARSILPGVFHTHSFFRLSRTLRDSVPSLAST